MPPSAACRVGAGFCWLGQGVMGTVGSGVAGAAPVPPHACQWLGKRQVKRSMHRPYVTQARLLQRWLGLPPNRQRIQGAANGNAFVARSWPGAGGSCGHGRGGGPGEEGVCPGGGALGWHEAQAAGLASLSRHCNTSIPVELLTGTVNFLCTPW